MAELGALCSRTHHRWQIYVSGKTGSYTYGMSDIGGGKRQQVGKGVQDGVALSPDDCRYDLHAHLQYGVDPDYDQKPARHACHNQHHWCLCNNETMSLHFNLAITNVVVT